MNSMNIRKYRSGDLEGVARLFNDYRIFYGQNPDIGLAVRFISDRIENSESVIFVERNYLLNK